MKNTNDLCINKNLDPVSAYQDFNKVIEDSCMMVEAEPNEIPASCMGFIEIFNDYYKTKLFTDNLFINMNLDETSENIDIIKDMLMENEKIIPHLCDLLVSCGHIIPMLNLALCICMFRYKKTSPNRILYTNSGAKYFQKFTEQLRIHCKETINGQNLADICKDYIKWRYEKINDSSFNNAQNLSKAKRLYIALSRAYFRPSEYICTRFLGLDNEKWRFHNQYDTIFFELPEEDKGSSIYAPNREHIKMNELHDIITKKINLLSSDEFARASWIISSIYLYVDPACKAYLSKKYILPAFNNTDLRHHLSIKQRVIHMWGGYTVLLTGNSLYSDKIKAECEKLREHYTEDAAAYHYPYYCSMCYDRKSNSLLNMSFEEAVSSYCKGFGVAMKDFLNNDFRYVKDGKTREERAIRLEEYRAKEHLMVYLSSDGLLQILKRRNIVELFADGRTDEAIKEIVLNTHLYMNRAFEKYGMMEHEGMFSPNEQVAFFKAFYSNELLDLSTKTALYNIIKDQITNYSLNYPDDLMEKIDEEMNSYVLETVKPLITKIKKAVTELNTNYQKYLTIISKPDADDAEITKMEAEALKGFAEIDRYMNAVDIKTSKFEIRPSSEYNDIIINNIEKFYKMIEPDPKMVRSDPEKDIFSVLKPKYVNIVKSYLRQGALIEHLQTHIKDIGWQEELDYSASILYMTKALELVGNLLYKRLIDNRPITNSHKLKAYISDPNRNNTYVWKENITLGNIGHLFLNGEFRASNPNTNNNVLSIDDLINKSKLTSKHLARKPAYYNYNKNPVELVEFTDDFENNIEIIGKALNFIASEFRNPSAHWNMSPEEKYEKCKELMITTEFFFWIILYIIEDGTILGD